jgi:hypothetical protein
LTVLVLLYGLSLFLTPPKYWETYLVSGLFCILLGTVLIRIIPALISFFLGDEEPHLVRTGDRTFRRCGMRELGKLILLVIVLRLVEILLTYVIHFARFGYEGTFFEVQRMWLDFYHAETAFPLYGYLSDIFWVVSFNFNHARFIGSYVFTTFAVGALYYLVLFDYDRKTARRAVRYFLFLPFSALLMGTVPDGLFLLLSILSLLFMRKKVFPLANLFAMLAVLTHAFGILLFVPIVSEYAAMLIRNMRSNKAMGKGYFLKQLLNVLSFLLIPLGIGLVMLYSRLRLGDAMTLYRTAFGMNGGSLFSPIIRWTDTALDQTLLIRPGTVVTILATYLPHLLYLIGALVLIGFSCTRVPASYVMLMTVTVPAILATGNLSSAAGILTMTAPFCIAFAVRVKKTKTDLIIMLSLIVLWLLYFYLFICGYTGGAA